jgi:hypothetical protein
MNFFYFLINILAAKNAFICREGACALVILT